MRLESKNIKITTIDMILDSVRMVVDACVGLKLECRKVPATTARLLRSLGYNAYQVKKFWEDIEPLNYRLIPLYKSGLAEFDIKIVVDEGPLYEAIFRGKYFVPVSEEDLNSLDNYLFAPKAHRLYLRIAGRAGGYMDINLVRIMLLAERKFPNITTLIIKAIRRYLREGDVSGLEEVTRHIVKNFGGLLSIVIPLFPKTPLSLREFIPLLRRITK